LRSSLIAPSDVESAGYSRHFKFLRRKQVKYPVAVAEQQRIAAFLDQADALRRMRRTAIEKLQSLQLSLFYEAFGDPATNPKRLPMGTIGDLAESTQYGTSSRANGAGALPILRMGNINMKEIGISPT
jgi:type I restriction enzyme, S subunit